ncbi:MAG: glycosyltransferase family 4 protein [Gemmatimonadaceae bacterium]|nr:glycosyltransferase family 4 protein [Gemmatimonadaceae bacterium]
MRILHLAFAGTDQAGVHRKLSEQVTSLRAHGAEVESLVVADTRTAPAPCHAPYRVIDVPGGGFDLPGRATAFAQCLEAAQTFAPDVVYLRYPIYDAEVQHFVRAAPPVVFELQTIFRNEASPQSAAAEAAWADRVLPMTSGLVGVTREILDDELSRAARAAPGCQLPGHVMPNGADPRTIPFMSPQLAEDRVDLLCVASFYPWHGIDRLVVGFVSEPDVRDVHLHLVGDGPTVAALRALVNDAGMGHRIHFHGHVRVSELGPWYARAHVAIGSLAPHRVGLRELAALKHREYVLRGIPMILAGGDADFTTALPWFRQFPADDSPISPRILRALALGWSHEARRRQIRQWAESHVSWDAKIPLLLNFLQQCAARGAPHRDYVSA